MLTRPRRRATPWLLLLLLIPFVALLWPPFYNFDKPEFIGIPFFYWYQILWIILVAILMAIVYFLGA